MTTDITQELINLNMKSYSQGGVDTCKTLIESFQATATILQRNYFTIDEIIDCLETTQKQIEIKKPG